MHALPDVPGGLARLAIIELNSAIGTDRDQQVSIGAKGRAVDKALVQVVRLASKLERRAMQKAHAAIVADGRGAQRPLLTHAHGIDDLAVAADLADAVARVGRDAGAEALAAVADGNDALRVAVPGDVVDAAADDVVLALGVDSLEGVPDAHGARDVARGYVEARGGEARDGGGRGVACVLLADFGGVDGAEEDGFAGLRGGREREREESISWLVRYEGAKRVLGAMAVFLQRMLCARLWHRRIAAWAARVW